MDLKKEDLIDACETCNGTGYFKEVSGATRGVGVRMTREGPCPKCDGRGGTLTEAGLAVAEVVRYVKRNG